MKWTYDEASGAWACPDCGCTLGDLFDDPDYSPLEFDYRFCPYCGEEAEETE